MLPSFPSFKRLELDDRPLIERVTGRFAPYSDFCFTSLWCWDVDQTCRVATLHDNLIVQLKDYTSDDRFFTFIGDAMVTETALTLLSQADRLGLTPQIRLLPAEVIAADPRLASRLRVVPDPAQFDYVCSVREWASLAGSAYGRHRHKVHRCLRRHHLACRDLDLTAPGTQAAMLRLVAQVHPATGEDSQGGSERAALRRLFRSVEQTPGALQCLGLYAEDALRGFSVWEAPPRGRYAIHHFMYADRSYPGLTSLLIHLRSCRLQQGGYAFANIEQDLGLPGLAAFKRSLRPCHFLHKYTISA